MNYNNHRDLPYYTFPSFDAYSGVRHAVLTRQGGISPAPWDSLNLGWTVGDDRANVEANYRRWAGALGLVREELTTTWQVHGNRVLVADGSRYGMRDQADALITRVPGLPLVQRYADCTPILLYDPVRQACGIAHAGWQGTVARCAEAAVGAMQQEFGCKPADLVAGVGPAIGRCCYEVGPEVVDAIRASHRDPDRLFAAGPQSHTAMLDLWEANAQQLHDARVTQVEVAGLCTSCHRQTFLSHRGDHGHTGRFAAFIMVQPAADSRRQMASRTL